MERSAGTEPPCAALAVTDEDSFVSWTSEEHAEWSATFDEEVAELEHFESLKREAGGSETEAVKCSDNNGSVSCASIPVCLIFLTLRHILLTSIRWFCCHLFLF